MEGVLLCLGDCLDVLRDMPDGYVDAVVTSPPYAMQRKDFYGGVPEDEYPDWLVAWAQPFKRVLAEDGNIAINIREHVRAGQISDYVHRSRLALRADGWVECDELIWFKPDAPPVGNPSRPRRSWERVLWFAKHGRSYCDPKANGHWSELLGISKAAPEWVAMKGRPYKEGVARGTDLLRVSVGNSGSGGHPAAYPVALAERLIKLLCPPGGTVCDPFLGSGSTAVAAIKTGRSFVGIEVMPDYLEIARQRSAEAAHQYRPWTPQQAHSGDLGPRTEAGS